MATIKYNADTSLAILYGSPVTIGSHSGTSATFVESVASPDRITFSGSGLSYDANDAFTGGKITKITFRSADGDVYAVMKDLDIKASQLPGLNGSAPTSGLLEFLYKGDDVIMGSQQGNGILSGYGGNDRIFGNDGNDSFSNFAGKDRITGGKGSDTYLTFTQGGKDVITDFDGIGSEHDRIETYAAFDLRKSGQDVIVDFIEDGIGDILLLDVKRGDVVDDIIFI